MLAAIDRYLEWLLTDAATDVQAPVKAANPGQIQPTLSDSLRRELRDSLDWLQRELRKDGTTAFHLVEEIRHRGQPFSAETSPNVEDEQWDRLACNLREIPPDHRIESDTVELRNVPDEVSNLFVLCRAHSGGRGPLQERLEHYAKSTPLEALRLVAIGLLLRHRCVDASQQSRFHLLQRQCRSRDASTLERSPGELVTSSGRAPRGPDSLRVTQTQALVIRWELAHAA